MGISNPEIQKKVFGPRWEHETEKHYHPGFQQIAFVDSETGELQERRLERKRSIFAYTK